MKHIIHSCLVSIFIALLYGCSYSPNSLEAFYNDMASEVADELSHSIDLNSAQRSEIEIYASELMQWHRHNKLPLYAQHLASLSAGIREGNLTAAKLKQTLIVFDSVPHFEEASHLTPRIARVANSLNDKQVNQLQQLFKRQLAEAELDIKNTSYAKDNQQAIKYIFRFINVALSDQQWQQINRDLSQLHDTRYLELNQESNWNKQLMHVLKQRRQPQFIPRFTQLWNKNESLQHLPQVKQNFQVWTRLLMHLFKSLSPEQRAQLASQLDSMSNKLSEMANK